MSRCLSIRQSQSQLHLLQCLQARLILTHGHPQGKLMLAKSMTYGQTIRNIISLFDFLILNHRG